MKTLSDIAFPETPEEAKLWEHKVIVRALQYQVLTVAHTRIEGMWCAYCAPVPGLSHDSEWQEVLQNGSKLIEKYARSIFPEFADIPYAR